jgi:hypothetical protein
LRVEYSIADNDQRASAAERHQRHGNERAHAPRNDVGRQAIPQLDYNAAEFLGSNGPERVKKCRQLAAN